eukprot:jgi/Tetstr1/433854/TSEL_023037.t1
MRAWADDTADDAIIRPRINTMMELLELSEVWKPRRSSDSARQGLLDVETTQSALYMLTLRLAANHHIHIGGTREIDSAELPWRKIVEMTTAGLKLIAARSAQEPRRERATTNRQPA